MEKKTYARTDTNVKNLIVVKKINVMKKISATN